MINETSFLKIVAGTTERHKDPSKFENEINEDNWQAEKTPDDEETKTTAQVTNSGRSEDKASKVTMEG